MDELFSAAECREHAVRGRLILAAHPETIEEHWISFAMAAPDGRVAVLQWSRSPKLDQAHLVFACFWDGKRTWTAADWGEVPPFPPETALFASLDDAQRALDASNR